MIGFFNSTTLQWVILAALFLLATPFFIRALKGQDLRRLSVFTQWTSGFSAAALLLHYCSIDLSWLLPANIFDIPLPAMQLMLPALLLAVYLVWLLFKLRNPYNDGFLAYAWPLFCMICLVAILANVYNVVHWQPFVPRPGANATETYWLEKLHTSKAFYVVRMVAPAYWIVVSICIMRKTQTTSKPGQR